MKKTGYFLVLSLVLSVLWGCGGKREEIQVQSFARPSSHVKIKVVDVSNDTKRLYDVDAIGMLWSALDVSLKNRGILWTGEASVQPLSLEARIIEYQKGSAWYRCLLPMWGNTVLEVECVLKDGERLIASVKAKQKVSPGSGAFTRAGWRKVFVDVAEEAVSQLAAKI